MNIWEHLDQFGDLDIKTSQRSKLGKKWKIGHFNQISKKGQYTRLFTQTLREAQEHVEAPRSTFEKKRPPKKFPDYSVD